MKARAMVQIGDQRLEMQEFDIPAIGPEEGLLRVEACGLCGSDVEQFHGGTIARGLAHYPMIPGHEPVGVIEALGPTAAARWGVRSGDRVALEPHLSCGACPLCLSGRYHLCRVVRPTGIPAYGYLPMDHGRALSGGYATHMHLHPRTVMHKLPSSLPLKLATMYQAIAGGVRWSVHLPGTLLGDTVLVLGAGQRGLGAVIACREAGVEKIIVTGLKRDAFKLELARALGAQHVIVADQEDTVARVMEITAGRGADVVVDLAPAALETVNHAIDAVKSGGVVVLAGLKGPKAVPFNADRAIFKEITIRGAFSQGWEAYEQALRILDEDRHGLARLKTHDLPLEDAAHAIRILAGEVPGEEGICLALHPRGFGG
jgi:threonine dehydrogenase-like Zn-dependent dehydrogenase